MAIVKSRTPMQRDIYPTYISNNGLKNVKSIIDREIKDLKKKQVSRDSVKASLVSLVDRYIEEEKLKLSAEYINFRNNTRYGLRCRTADKFELEQELDLIVAELDILKEDYVLFEKLYKESNPLHKEKSGVAGED